MEQELHLLNISKDVIDRVGDQFEPVFSKIRIYGTARSPVFILKDVESILGISDLNIRHKPTYKKDLHYKKITIPVPGQGVREVYALTEVGLNKAMHNSSHPIAEKYCIFISSVMSELRTHGMVTLETAMKRFQEENVRLTKKVEVLDTETDNQKYILDELQDEADRYRSTIERLHNKILSAEDDVDEAEYLVQKSGNIEYIQLLERAFLKPVYVHVKDIDEDDDASDLPENEIYTFRLSTKIKLNGFEQAAKMLMVNPTKQITQIGPDHEISLSDLRDIIETSNIQQLRAI